MHAPDAAPLDDVAARLRDGSLEPADYAATLYDRIDAHEPTVRAWVDGPKPGPQVEAEAEALAARYPDPEHRPPLFGVPVGVKDIFHVDGLPTRAGSSLPPGVLAGPEAAAVRSLREAGAYVLGKTATTEFAYFEPAPTRNPHDPEHTPGGSSSGSAAAVAAGTCPLALGTQTVGSVVRPAAFCGVVGFKPSYGRISLDGVLPLATAVDHVGLFTRDVAGMRVAAGVCVDDWTGGEDDATGDDGAARASDEAEAAERDRPSLGVPDDEYLSQATEAGRAAFEESVSALADAGFDVRRVRAFEDVEAVNDRHERLVAAEAARAHHEWFEAYPDRYAESTAALIRDGRAVSVGAHESARLGRGRLRADLTATMDDRGVDVWVAPSAPGPAPAGIESTGDPVMNAPWTHAGLPVVSVPSGSVDGLPVGLQCVARFGADEDLLEWAGPIRSAVSTD